MAPAERISPAAKSVLEKLAALPSTASAPVDIAGLGRVVRSTDALRGSVLLQVLLSLKRERKWQLSLSLATMLEATGTDAPQALEVDNVGKREILEHHENDEEAEDAEFRKMIASSPNFAGDAVRVEEDEFDEVSDGSGGAQSADDFSALSIEEVSALGGDADPMAALLPSTTSTTLTPLGGLADEAPPPVETTHYNVLIATCAASRRWQEALDLHVRMRERDVPRDTISYNSLLHSLDRGGRWKLALKLFKQMRTEGVPPNTVTFATMIAACGHGGQWEQALSILEMAFTSNTPRNTIVYSSAISACEKAGQWQVSPRRAPPRGQLVASVACRRLRLLASRDHALSGAMRGARRASRGHPRPTHCA